MKREKTVRTACLCLLLGISLLLCACDSSKQELSLGDFSTSSTDGTSSNEELNDLNALLEDQSTIELAGEYDEATQSVKCKITSPDVYSYVRKNQEKLKNQSKEAVYEKLADLIKNGQIPTKTTEVTLPAKYNNGQVQIDADSNEVKKVLATMEEEVNAVADQISTFSDRSSSTTKQKKGDNGLSKQADSTTEDNGENTDNGPSVADAGEESSDGESVDVKERYKTFLEDEEYTNYYDEICYDSDQSVTSLPEEDNVDGYALTDLDDDTVPELLIRAQGEDEWFTCMVFSYDADEDKILHVGDLYCCQFLQYSAQYHALFSTDIRPTDTLYTYGYTALQDGTLKHIMVLSYEASCNEDGTYAEDGTGTYQVIQDGETTTVDSFEEYTEGNEDVLFHEIYSDLADDFDGYKELSGCLDNWTEIDSAVGGVENTDENGQTYYQADGLEYYPSSNEEYPKVVAQVNCTSEAYALFHCYVGQDYAEAKKLLEQAGWSDWSDDEKWSMAEEKYEIRMRQTLWTGNTIYLNFVYDPDTERITKLQFFNGRCGDW